jgi:hypothetical protein
MKTLLPFLGLLLSTLPSHAADHLTGTSTWQAAVNFPGSTMSRGTLPFERVK